MNIWDILILVLIAGAVVLALRRIFTRKKQGCAGCCEGCAGCPGCSPKEDSRSVSPRK